MIRVLLVLVTALVCLPASTVSAQNAEQRVLELNQRAMEAYTELDIETARRLLQRALRIAERKNVEGRALARTYVNLGVIVVGGEDDRQSGFEFFKAALVADPTIEPDPSNRTPAVEETFELARGRYEMETGRKASGTAPSPEEVAAGAEAEGETEGEAEAAEEADETEPYDWGETRRSFVHLGLSIGAATVQSGKPADPALPPECLDNSGALLPECASYVKPGDQDCDAAGGCVRVRNPGVLPTLGVTLTAGYYVTPRLALATTLRAGFGGGGDTLNQWMIGARAQYAFAQPDPEGLHAGLFAGGSVGQIQAAPDQGETGGEPVRDPYVTSGLGSLQLGSVIGYRFVDWFGIQATPQVHLFFPTFMTVLEITVGTEFAF